MRNRIAGPQALGLLFSLSLLAIPAASQPQESWTARYPLAAGSRVTVTNVEGSITVEGWERAEVELIVMMTPLGPEASPGDVSVAIEPLGDSFHVRTLYRGVSQEPVAVDYHLRVPRQTYLEELRTVNGSIAVRNVEGTVDAGTLNGDITQSGIAGSVTARTVNGNVSLSLRRLPGRDGRLHLESINGDLQLRLPAEPNADLELSTVAGRIESEPPLAAAAADYGDTAVRARLGRGGARVRLRTVRGNIRLSEGTDLL